MATAIMSFITGTGVSCAQIFPIIAVATTKIVALPERAGTKTIGKPKKMAVGYGYQTKRSVVSNRSMPRPTSAPRLRVIASTPQMQSFAL